MPQFRAIKLLGERNTGSRYLMQLVELNLKLPYLPHFPPSWIKSWHGKPGFEWLRTQYFAWTYSKNLGWKHHLPDADFIAKLSASRGVLFLICIKEPYSFLTSLYKRPYHHPLPKGTSFAQFLQQEWTPIPQERAPSTFANPIQLWNTKHRAYLALADRLPSLLIDHRELQEGPAAVMQSIAARMGLAAPSTFQDVTESTKDQGKPKGEILDFYRQRQWLKQYTPETLAWVNSQLDAEVMRRLNYSLLEPGEARQ
jgi:hypothetical protein